MKIRKNRNLIHVLILSLVLLLSGCYSNTVIKPADESVYPTTITGTLSDNLSSDLDRITIGVSLLDGDNLFIKDIQNAMIQRANELGVVLKVLDGKNSPERQINQIQTFITKQVDVIVINPSSFDKCAPAVDAAIQAGIPIMTVNTKIINQDKCRTFVGSDAVESGRIQMEYVAQTLGGSGSIVYINGQIGHEAQIGRHEGARQVLQKYPDIKIVYNQSGNWSRDEGYAIIENYLRLGKSVDAIVCQNDEMALGAIAAINDTGYSGRIEVFGIDALPEALDSVISGAMRGTVFQDGRSQGIQTINIAQEIAEGREVNNTYYFPYVLVTKENAAKYLK